MALAEKTGKALRGLLPRRAGNRAVLGFFELLRRLHRLTRPAAAPEETEAAPGAYIEDQRSRGAEPYGRVTVCRGGCGVIAVYNALLALQGAAPPLEALLRSFERDGLMLGGFFGTAPGAARDYLRRRGFVLRSAVGEEQAARLAARADMALLTFWNDRDDVTAGVHTVCCTRAAGGWTVHNLWGGGAVPPPGPDLLALTDTGRTGRCRLILLMTAAAPPPRGPREKNLPEGLDSDAAS